MDIDSIDEILLPERRAQRGPVAWTLIRELTLDDLAPLMDSGALTPQPANARNLSSVRSTHHMIAQLMAEGKGNAEISLIMGYNPGYLSALRNDPAFRELLAYYGTEREKVFVDVLERMKGLGVHALEELHERVEQGPEKFKNRELLEIAELMLVKGSGSAAGASVGPAVNISVNFVPSPGETPGQGSTPILDLVPNSGENK